MRFILPLLIVGVCTIFFSSSITTNQAVNNIMLVNGELVPDLPSSPYNYEDQDFPSALQNTQWGQNDPAVLATITDHGATLGRVLFYDELLSANENLSCATCHKQELSFADNTRFSQGVDVATNRNSMHLNDLGWTSNIGFFWDMSETNLKEMIALPLKNENEIGLTDLAGVIAKMEATDYYPQLFRNAFGNNPITMSAIQEALKQFISAMTTFNSKFDKSQRFEALLTHKEEHGRLLFEENCGICHFNGNSFLFFDPGGSAEENMRQFPFAFSNGLPIENGDIGAGEWEPEFTGLFKAPTLRNIELTAPYMHDGRFETLEEVLEHYNEGVVENDWEFLPVGGLQLNDEDTEAIIAFLKTMTDRTFTTDVRYSDPFVEKSSEPVDPEIVINPPKLYPNPTSGWTSVNFENPRNFKAEVLINDMQGRLMRKMSTNEEQLAMDVSSLASGTYYISVNVKGKIVQEKLIVF